MAHLWDVGSRRAQKVYNKSNGERELMRDKKLDEYHKRDDRDCMSRLKMLLCIKRPEERYMVESGVFGSQRTPRTYRGKRNIPVQPTPAFSIRVNA